MINKLLITIFSVPLLISFLIGGETGIDFTKYHNPQEINKFLSDLVKSNKDISRLHKIADTPGRNRVYILEIGDQVRMKRKLSLLTIMAFTFFSIIFTARFQTLEIARLWV